LIGFESRHSVLSLPTCFEVFSRLFRNIWRLISCLASHRIDLVSGWMHLASLNFTIFSALSCFWLRFALFYTCFVLKPSQLQFNNLSSEFDIKWHWGYYLVNYKPQMSPKSPNHEYPNLNFCLSSSKSKDQLVQQRYLQTMLLES